MAVTELWFGTRNPVPGTKKDRKERFYGISGTDP